MATFNPQSLTDIGNDLDSLSEMGNQFCAWQGGIYWWIGDLARTAKGRWPDRWQQVFPESMSPGLIQRCAAVSEAYKPNERNTLCTWTQHMQNANKPDRLERLASIAEQGQTTDESRRNSGARWLLAVDVNYYVHRFWHSGAGVSSADDVTGWIKRTATRLSGPKNKGGMGLTDVVCCFDSSTNFRKELTKDWERKYKDRPDKDPELKRQLHLAFELLSAAGFCCCGVEGFESDDVMASYAKQFDGKVTILTQDKDLKQCLSPKCNMLLDVEFQEDETSGKKLPKYTWLTAAEHTRQNGISPDVWTDYQCIMGDNADGIRGAEGIGQKGAADLIQMFGTVDNAIAAAMSGDERIPEKKRASLVALSASLETVRQLVTMRDDLDIRMDTTFYARDTE